MNIPEAIEIQKDLSVGGQQIPLEKRLAACGLGIEALKDHLKARAAGWLPPGYKLPGETEETPRLAHFHQPALVDVDKRSTK